MLAQVCGTMVVALVVVIKEIVCCDDAQLDGHVACCVPMCCNQSWSWMVIVDASCELGDCGVPRCIEW